MTTSMEPHCLPFRELPHTTKLFTAFTEDFKRVARYLAHPPTEAGVLAAAREVRLDPETRRTVVEVLREQNARFASGSKLPAETAKNLDRLAAGSVAIVTGQQVGLFSGPAYSIYKAISALRWADAITKRGTDAVPIFWLATEDHDLAEVNHSDWNTRAKASARSNCPLATNDADASRRRSSSGRCRAASRRSGVAAPSGRVLRRRILRRSSRILRVGRDLRLRFRQADGAHLRRARNYLHRSARPTAPSPLR